MSKTVFQKEDIMAYTQRRNTHDFILSIYGAPEQVRDHITIQNAVTWSVDVIRERMKRVIPTCAG